VDWRLAGEAKKCCESAKAKKNCCRDVQIAFDVDDDQTSPDLLSAEFSPAYEMIASLPSSNKLDFSSVEAGLLQLSDHAPPDMLVRHFYLLYEVFRL